MWHTARARSCDLTLKLRHIKETALDLAVDWPWTLLTLRRSKNKTWPQPSCVVMCQVFFQGKLASQRKNIAKRVGEVS